MKFLKVVFLSNWRLIRDKNVFFSSRPLQQFEFWTGNIVRVKYSHPSLFYVEIFTVLNIRALENRGKPRIKDKSYLRVKISQETRSYLSLVLKDDLLDFWMIWSLICKIEPNFEIFYKIWLKQPKIMMPSLSSGANLITYFLNSKLSWFFLLYLIFIFAQPHYITFQTFYEFVNNLLFSRIYFIVLDP